MTEILSLDILAFFERVTGYKPTKFQSELLISFLDPNVSKIAICAGRQTGKTLCSAVAVVYLSIHRKEGIVLASAQDSWGYSHIRDIFNKCPEIRDFIVSEGVYSIVPLKGYETTTGSKVHVRGSTDKSLRGIPATIVFLDEAELLTDESLQTALGNLSGQYKYILLGTPPRDRKGLFYQIIKDPIEHNFRLFKWSAEGCSWHPPELLATKKKMLKEFYKPEVQGEILEEAERGIVAAKDVDACVKDFLSPEGGTIEAGIDWASGNRCKTVITIIERIAGARVKVLLSRGFNSEEIGTMFQEVARILRQWKPSRIKVDALPPEYVKDLQSVYGGKFYPVNFGEFDRGCTLKNVMLGQLIHKVQTHQLSIPVQFNELIKQLKAYRRGLQYNDDYVDSLCLAIFFDLERFKPSLHGGVYVPRKKVLFTPPEKAKFKTRCSECGVTCYLDKEPPKNIRVLCSKCYDAEFGAPRRPPIAISHMNRGR
jgi:hypothetical protein